MKKTIPIDLPKLAQQPSSKIAAMVAELEGRGESDSSNATWASRFVAIGGKRATSHR